MSTRVALNSHFEKFVRDQVDSGRYASASEVIRAGLQLLEERYAEQDIRLAKLRNALAAGLGSGEPVPAEDVFVALETQYSRMSGQET